MAKKNRKRVRSKPGLPELTGLGSGLETRAAEVATIAWMLMFIVAVLAEITAAAGALLAYYSGVGEDSPLSAAFVPVMLFSAAVAGGLCLMLTPLVHNLRRVKPPPVITLVAVIAALVPLGVVALWPLVVS